jgi:hypothetical protein
MREFPHLVELHQKHPEDVAAISVSLDYAGLPNRPPESYREQVQKFLDKVDAQFENVLCSDVNEDVFKTLGIISIPAVQVYDRSGKLRQMFSASGFTYENDIIPVVEQLIAEE